MNYCNCEITSSDFFVESTERTTGLARSISDGVSDTSFLDMLR